MKEKDAIKKFFPNPDDTTFGRMFIFSLYKQEYIIITPEEKKKIDDAVKIAHIHGMNPFDKK